MDVKKRPPVRIDWNEDPYTGKEYQVLCPEGEVTIRTGAATFTRTDFARIASELLYLAQPQPGTVDASAVAAVERALAELIREAAYDAEQAAVEATEMGGQ